MRSYDWHMLPDGREGLYRHGVCLAAIRHDPARVPPYQTESVGPDGSRSLRNCETREEAIEHCEWVINGGVRSGADIGWKSKVRK